MHNQLSSTWREEGGEIVKDLRVSLPSCETDHRAYIQREGPQLLPRAQTIHLQHILYVMKETHKQVAGVRTGGKHCRRDTVKRRQQLKFVYKEFKTNHDILIIHPSVLRWAHQ